MKALVYRGAKKVGIETRPDPVIGNAHDAIIRVTSTTICGSDLHLYHGDVPETRSGDVFGHEFMGIVEDVGADVKNVKRGDRVVVSAVIACGACEWCRRGEFSLCDTTNPSLTMRAAYGTSICGAFGYSHMTGGYDGGQAEYVRVPHADVGCLKIPDGLTDDQVLFLSDILCTGWHANELAETGPGQTIVVFGCGPVGLMAMASARARGVERIIAFDEIPYRLETARKNFGAEAINFKEDTPLKTIRELTEGRGPDACLETVGFRYTRSLHHKVERALKLETDGIDSLADAILGVRKGGHVAIIGDFFGYTNHFPVGAMMEKGITVRGGQVYVQKYWQALLGMIESGTIDTTFAITHHMPLDRTPEAYAMFDEKRDGALKIVLHPGATPAA